VPAPISKDLLARALLRPSSPALKAHHFRDREFRWRNRIMLVLSRKCAEKVIVGGDIVINVVEIHGQRVRLGLAPPAGQPIDLQEDCSRTAADQEVVPEVRCIGGSSQLLVWSRPGTELCINESVQVRVVTVDRDRVRLGIVAPCETPVRRGECGSSAKAPSTQRAADREQTGGVLRVSAEVLSDWVARKIKGYLVDRPRGALQKLAQVVGVSSVSINRWRNRQSNVATEHLSSLLPALGVGLDDLARELRVEQVLPPQIPARGPAPRVE
jgi:sRNA-binding carbon storage regulator CsrA